MTPTLPAGAIVIDPPYPNPAPNGDLYVPITAPAGSTVQMVVYTTAYRKVLEKGYPYGGGSSLLLLELRDQWGSLLPDGLYYLKVTVTDPAGKTLSKIFTLVVRR